MESRLDQKLASGEISRDEYEKLRTKFEKLGMLSSSKTSQTSSNSVHGEGSTKIKGGKVNGAVNVHGRAEVESSLECNRLFISGSVTVNGDLTVLGKSSISGDLDIKGLSRFMDRIAVSGRLRAGDNVYSLAKVSLSGRTNISGDLVTEGITLISGKTTMENLRSTGDVKISGKLGLKKDLIAKTLEISSGKINIRGSIKSEKVSIFEQFLQSMHDTGTIEDTETDDTISGLVSNVVNVVFPTLVNSIKGLTNMNPSLLEVEGDIEGSDIKLSYCYIHGDLIGDTIEIGPNVTMGGKIKYRKSIKLPPNHVYDVENI